MKNSSVTSSIGSPQLEVQVNKEFNPETSNSVAEDSLFNIQAGAKMSY